MYRASAALFLSLLAACAPTAAPHQVYFDSFYTSTVGGLPAPYDGRHWVYEDPAYVLSYSLGAHTEGAGPGSIKLELEARRPVLIAWDKSSLTDSNGAPSPLTHEGVPYKFRPADTELAPQSRLKDRVVPRNNLVVTGDRVTNARYLVPPSEIGESTLNLRLVINGQTLDIRLDGTRQ